MTRTTLGFYIAAAYNLCIILFSQGFSNALGEIDPLFSPDGCFAVLLWGAAYFALANRYTAAPAVALVFAIEKAFYSLHWLLWMSENAGELSAMIEADFLTGLFFTIYGVGDLLFMVFFGWVAWMWRDRLSGSLS